MRVSRRVCAAWKRAGPGSGSGWRRSSRGAVEGLMRTVPFVLALSAALSSVAQPPSLVRVGSVSVPGPVSVLAAGDGYLVAAGGSRVHVIDLSRPESPEVVGGYDFEQPALGVVLDGRLAYVANSHDGLRRLDLSELAAPVLTGTAGTRGQAVGVAASGRHAFAADNSIGFDVVDGAGAFARAGEYLGDGFPRGIGAAGSRVFVADQPAGLIVVDVSAPASPRVAGRLSLGRDPVLQVVRAGRPLDRRRAARRRRHRERARRAAGGRRLGSVRAARRRGGAGRRAAERGGAVGPPALCGFRRRAAGVRPDRSRAARARGLVRRRSTDRSGGGRCGACLPGSGRRGRRLPARVGAR